MANLLLEIFSEEIPARMQLKAGEDLKTLFSEKLKAQGLRYSSIETFVGPRRLGAHIEGLDEKTEAVSESRRGPKIGAPEPAINGFLKSVGLTLDQCTQENGYWVAELKQESRQTAGIIPDIINQILAQFSWPKSMRWHGSSQTWVRPIRSLICIFGGKTLVNAVPSLGLITGNKSRGHRFLSSGEITVSDFDDYKTKLGDASVILNHHVRQSVIQAQLNVLAKEKGLTVVSDLALLEEVSGLVEYPMAMLGKIDQEFMGIPAEVLSTSMRVHQRYFTLHDSKGNMAPYFGVIANMKPTPEMLKGYERVLRARLSDAKFFFEQDLKIPLQDLLPKLNEIVFQAQLGTLAQKVDRLQNVMKTQEGKRAARLCKADLLTQMVGEFPELQGVMGKIYALKQNEGADVALAMHEHYQPLGPNDSCPTNQLSVELGLADKMDTLVGFLGNGMEPTGSKDPFALRRAALGVIRLIIENNLKNYNLSENIQKSIESYKKQRILLSNPNALETVIDFIITRLTVYLKGQGIEHDCVQAVLMDTDDIWSLSQRGKAIAGFLKTSDGIALKSAFRRAHGIVKKSEKNKLYLRGEFLLEPAEIKLHDALNTVAQTYDTYLRKDDYVGLMGQLATLRQPVDNFFDTVTVNCDDEKIRNNRLALLQLMLDKIQAIGDFTKLEG